MRLLWVIALLLGLGACSAQVAVAPAPDGGIGGTGVSALGGWSAEAAL